MEAPVDELARPSLALVPLQAVCPFMSFAEADEENALARFRSNWTFSGKYGAVSGRLCHRMAIDTQEIPFAGVNLDVDGEALTLWLPARALSAMAMAAGAAVNLAEVHAVGRGLLFEYVLGDLLVQAEAAGFLISVRDVSNPIRNPAGRIGLICTFGQLPPFPAIVECSPSVAKRLMRAADALPDPAFRFSDMPVVASFLAGVTWLRHDAFLALRDGDSILFDHSWLQERRAPIIIGEAIILVGKVLARGFEVEGLTPVADIKERMAWLTDDRIGEGAQMNEGETSQLSALEVKLVFEVGRLTLTMAELNQLDAGHVFELNRQPEQAVDIYVLNKHVGKGELVMIGKSVGVRMTKILR